MSYAEVKFPEMQRTNSYIVNQTYSYINNTGFYALANPVTFDYMQRIVRRNSWWLDGYVPDFHNGENGIFSTRFANALVNGTSKQIVGRKVSFKNTSKVADQSDDPDLTKMDDWGEKVNLTKNIRELTKYGLGLGTSLIKLNKSGSELWVDALRFDDFFFESDFKGELVNVTCLLKGYVDTSNSKEASKLTLTSNKDGDQLTLKGRYYLVEHRYFADEEQYSTESTVKGITGKKIVKRIPKAVYQVHRYNGNITTAQDYNPSIREDVDWKAIPQNVKKSIIKDFGAIKLGEPITLPFDDYLGCELLKIDDGDTSLSQLPFGQSILQNIISYLMGYDLAYSWFIRDLDLGKGTVLAPKNMIQADSDSIQDKLLTMAPTIDPASQTPMSIQFQLRVAEWANARNYFIECIATQIGMNPSTIASFISDNTARTARQVSTEESTTLGFIESQRENIESVVNHMLKYVSNFYGLKATFKIQFNYAGAENVEQRNQSAIERYQAGILDLKSAIKITMPDANEEQINKIYSQILTEQKEKEKLKNEMFNSPGFGGGGSSMPLMDGDLGEDK